MGTEPTRTHDVFVSYSSKDKTWADAACAVLERHRIRCWIAPRDIAPGDEWGAEIVKGIHGSRIMVLIFSGHSNASGQVRREVERAISQGMKLVLIPAGEFETGSADDDKEQLHGISRCPSPVLSLSSSQARPE
jgi:hypothetical protein